LSALPRTAALPTMLIPSSEEDLLHVDNPMSITTARPGIWTGWLSYIGSAMAVQAAIPMEMVKICKPCWARCCGLMLIMVKNIPSQLTTLFPWPRAARNLAYGLRNPWRFSFDHLTATCHRRCGPGRLEELDFVAAGIPGA